MTKILFILSTLLLSVSTFASGAAKEKEECQGVESQLASQVIAIQKPEQFLEQISASNIKVAACVAQFKKADLGEVRVDRLVRKNNSTMSVTRRLEISGKTQSGEKKKMYIDYLVAGGQTTCSTLMPADTDTCTPIP